MKTLNPKEIIQAQQAMCTLENCFNEVDLESIKSQIDNSVKQLEVKIKEIVPILHLTLEDDSFNVIFAIDFYDVNEYVTSSRFSPDGLYEFKVISDHDMFHYEEKLIKAYLNLLTCQQ